MDGENDQVMGDEQETAAPMPEEGATEGADAAPEMPAEETGEEEVA